MKNTIYGLSEDNPPIKKEIQEYMYSHQKISTVLWHPIVATSHDIPKSLKEWRIYRDFTLRDVEEKTGISNAYLSQLETGKVKKPSFDVVVKLCNLYIVKLII